jgi:hypothetical protein
MMDKVQNPIVRMLQILSFKLVTQKPREALKPSGAEERYRARPYTIVWMYCNRLRKNGITTKKR